MRVLAAFRFTCSEDVTHSQTKLIAFRNLHMTPAESNPLTADRISVCLRKCVAKLLFTWHSRRKMYNHRIILCLPLRIYTPN